MNPIIRDRFTLSCELGARLLFAIATFLYFIDLPLSGWTGHLPLMVAALVGYVMLQSLLFARALYDSTLNGRESWWVPGLAAVVDGALVFGALVSDPYDLPPTLLLALLAALNLGMRHGIPGFLAAMLGAGTVIAGAMSVRGWHVDIAVAHALDYSLVFMALGLGWFALLARRRQILAEDAARHADIDTDTQLLNRHGFDMAMRHLAPLQHRTKMSAVIMVASLDLRGGAALDRKQRLAAVKQFGHTVRQRARRSDVVARIADDEFVFMLFDTPPAGAETLARAMVGLFDGWASSQQPAPRLTFGLIAMPEEPAAIDQLIARVKSSVLRAQKHPSSPSVVSAPPL